MVALDAGRRNHPVARLALWSLGAGIVATVGANLAHGLGHGPVGALVSAWPALALVRSFEFVVVAAQIPARSGPATCATPWVISAMNLPGPDLRGSAESPAMPVLHPRE